MDFDDSPEEATLRTAARAWLAAEAPAFEVPAQGFHDDAAEVRAGRSWLRHKFESDYAGIMLPTTIGGRGGTMMEAIVFAEEEARFRVPRGAYLNIGLNMALPVILAHGSPAQTGRFAEPTLRGEFIWCQLFSEPAAGSDLAALRCRAVRDGDGWLINGQKLWSSWAHQADWGILLARTDPSVPKHKGLTLFVLDMRTPGIDVRSIRQISGASDFNETFLVDVRIPDECRIGPVGGGWACAMTVLTGERLSNGGSGRGRGIMDLIHRAQTLASSREHFDGRTQLALAYAEEEAERFLQARLRTMIFKGDSPGALAAIVKLAYANRLQRSSGLAIELAGPAGTADTSDDPDLRTIWGDYIWSVAMRVAGGADEVLRNQLAERLLGMPSEPRADKDTPFDRIS